jgi:type I restriction enzyme S subunit
MTVHEDAALAPWVGSLPTRWRAERIDAVADVLFSNVDKHTVDGEDPVRLCNYVDVYSNARITAALEFMEATAEPREIRKFQIRLHDVLATKDSEEHDDIAIAALVAEDLPGVICGYHLAIMRPRSRRLSGPFLAWVHASKQIRAQYEARAVGVTRFGLSQHAFRAALIPVPPREEQERIAAFLDTNCASIDAAVETKQRQIQALDAVRESLIASAVTTGIRPGVTTRGVNEEWVTEVPAHWDVRRIKRLLSRVDYGISESTEPEGRYPVLKMGHIQRGEVAFRNLDYVDEVEEDLLLDKGDLLYNRTNSPDQVGKAAIFRGSKADQVTFASYLVRLRTNHLADPLYLNYLVNSSGFLSFARKLAIPSVQQSNLNSTRYSRMLVPVPPVAEQREIAAYLDEKMAELARIVTAIEGQISVLRTYRKSLIHEYVTGVRRLSEDGVAKATAHG